eukprot:TRINITY_DN19734_c1_g1_i5.p1 TRINITY_DN19734_c1_g1~~TRINITY_DN19734_c1_g1_i5.p1  ORF type:complete len:235 (+),score=13.18 TRINITY_DN19734_c1_g1_i5:143-847(+)
MACLRLLLKFANYVLLFAGLATIGFSIYLIVGWKEASGHPFQDIPWFFATAGGVGIFVFITALIGICGADNAHRRCCLNFYIFLICVLLVAQIVIVVFLFMKSLRDLIPQSSSTDIVQIQQFVEKNIKIVRYGAIAILVVEAIAVFSSCILSVQDVDSRGDRQEDADAYQPFFATSYPSAYAGGAPVNYNSKKGAAKYFSHQQSQYQDDKYLSRRMKEKYLSQNTRQDQPQYLV